MKIEDNFLEENIFDELQSFIMGDDISWYYNPYIVDEGEKEFQFTHAFYRYNTPQSSHYPKLLPIIDKLDLIFSASSLSAIIDYFVRYNAQRPFDDQFQWLNESVASFGNYIGTIGINIFNWI